MTTNPLQQDKEVENDRLPTQCTHAAPIHNRNVPLIRLSTVRILPKADVQKKAGWVGGWVGGKERQFLRARSRIELLDAFFELFYAKGTLSQTS